MTEKKFERVEPIRKTPGRETQFLPVEVVDKVEHLFFVQELDGPAVEKRLDIRRPLFERAARAVFNRQRDPNGPKAMGKAASATGAPSLVRRMA